MNCVRCMVLAASVLAAGCGFSVNRGVQGGTPCTALYAYGVSATVTCAVNGDPINDATLTLTDGGYSEVMQFVVTGDYVGAGERAGTYSLTAVAAGYISQTINGIVVTADECHVQGVHVAVQLQPE